MTAPLLQRPLNAVRWRHHAVGLALALLHGALLFATLPETGVPRDESFYFYAADRAADWVEGLFDPEVRSFSRAEIDRGFRYNNEHPVLMKTLFGVSHRLFHERWGLIDDHRSAYRLPTVVMAALAIWLAWLLGVIVQGPLAGLVAAVALAFLPRYFFYGHLACFDGPVTFMWLLGAYTFLRAARSRAWAPVCGVAIGLGMATKLNIFFLPFTLLGVAIIDAWTWKRRHGRWTAPRGERGPIAYHAWTAASIVVLGTAVFLAHWPWLYYDTFERLKAYYLFHARHVHYPVAYLGEVWFRPPFPVHFPFVTSLFTLPVGTMVLAGIGAAVLIRRAWRAFRTPSFEADRRAADVLVLANALVPFLIIAAPGTPIFGGTKHWMTAMPFIAVMAGVGAERLARGLFAALAPARRALAGGAVALGMLAPAAWATLDAHPHGPTWYNELIGGPAGAAAAGMQRNFWGYSTIAVLPVLNERAERGALAFWHDATRWSFDAYKRDGLLRPDIRYTGDWTAAYSDWAVYHDERPKLPEELDIWRAYGTDWPVDGFFYGGVQVIGVYRRPEPPRPPPVPPGAR